MFRCVPAFVIGSTMFFQCSSNIAQTRNAVDSIAVSHVGEPFHQQTNKTETHVLVQSQDTARVAKYAVLRLNDLEVVFNGNYNRGGYARWVGDNRIEVLNIPSYVTEVSDTALYKREILIDGIQRGE